MQHRPGMDRSPVVVGISGGSGAAIAKRIIDSLLEAQIPVVCTITSGGRQVWAQEMDEPFSRALDAWSANECFSYYTSNQLGAPIASGGIPTRGMIVAACSMATVAAISHGLGDNLLRRAADVTIKERRPLVLIPRESPLSAIHLENMKRLAELGATILMPAPAFYLKPRTVDEIIEYFAARALNAIDSASFPLPTAFQYEASTTKAIKPDFADENERNAVSEEEES